MVICSLLKKHNSNPFFALSGFLNIFSSFNKRRWGKRWCMVVDNMFECYKTEESTVCEMNFFLCDCEVKRAVEETKSQLGLMITLNKVEKITVEVRLYKLGGIFITT